ncbi:MULTISPECIES: replication-associated recombination protein A [Cysteiniphilum]|uniref:Replication-associated recombination protein A n=1 Tax=Cysteiniphilum litorale TaxID=2056700 RepID=A0A8J3E7F4_9GAMM|nr:MULTISPECIES: replication-associated recombination protein A [Cysteiniphilum]GGF87460.1 recombination factor protein RarA [Cysteiniphilum litorale]
MSYVQAPLAYRMRPKNIKDYVGQRHLLGEQKILTRMLDKSHIVSMIFYGDPGVGKTTLAKVLAHELSYHFIELSAVSAGVKDIKLAVESAKMHFAEHQQATILFLDEIHRFNKSQQDALLPHVESGDLILIGATTENPFFSVNNALLSRLTVLRLKPLSLEDISELLQYVLIYDETLSAHELTLPDTVIEKIYHYAKGDCRQALNVLEMLFLMADTSQEKTVELNDELLNIALGENAHKLDKQGDYFYGQLSAFHKSVRGSDPDAAIFWLANMIESGADPLVIARRMLCIASEDIGNADPRALNIALDAWQSYERLGLPEGRLPLIQAAIYLASAPKSNASYMAYKNVFSDLKNHSDVSVPMHLRNVKPAGEVAGQSYKYPHDFPDAYVNQRYLPEGVTHQYYYPTDRGLESKIAQKLTYLKSKYKM